MRKKRPITLFVPAHRVMFRYSDVPREWHAMCLETSAFGSGASVDQALEGQPA